MTVVQLLERIARRSRTGDFTRLSLDEKLDVLQAANAGLQRAYWALPAYYREQTQGFTLPAPVYLNNVSVTSGSTVMSTNIFTPQQIGATINIPGDPQLNQILGTSTLRNPYLGPTGTVSGVIIYGDSLFSTSYPFDRIIGNPMFTDIGLGPLSPATMQPAQGNGNYLYQSTVGQPISWWVQYLGNSQGNQPEMVVKFAPLPDKAYAIKMRLSFWPLRLLYTDYQAATTLTVPDQYLEKGLIPICIQEFMTSTQWKSISPADDGRCEKRGQDAENFLRLQIADPSGGHNMAFTPLGF